MLGSTGVAAGRDVSRSTQIPENGDTGSVDRSPSFGRITRHSEKGQRSAESSRYHQISPGAPERATWRFPIAVGCTPVCRCVIIRQFGSRPNAEVLLRLLLTIALVSAAFTQTKLPPAAERKI